MDEAAHHLTRVLRMPAGAALVIFDGGGGEYDAVLEHVVKREVYARVGPFRKTRTESPLHITLGQGVSRGNRMDYALQKAVELGVGTIVPLVTERCGVRLAEDRSERKQAHWRAIVASACEQCGRNVLPAVAGTCEIDFWLAVAPAGLRLVLSPDAERGLRELPSPAAPVTLLIGPEGGLAEREIELAVNHGFTPVHLGPRVLRTETAAVAALAAIQVLWGDLGR